MSYIRTHTTTVILETIPEHNPACEGSTIIHVGISNDIELDKNSEEYRETLRELAINLTRTVFVSLIEKGVFTESELASVLAEKVYLSIKNDLLSRGGSSRLGNSVTLKEIVLDEEEEEEDNDQ